MGAQYVRPDLLSWSMVFVLGVVVLVVFSGPLLVSLTEHAPVPLLYPSHHFPRNSFIAQELSEALRAVSVDPQLVFNRLVKVFWF
jgi:hypothetical protein